MPEPGDIAAVVLAAGRSRRFGADKLLHPMTLNEELLPLAAHSLQPWLEVFVRVTVVIRPEADAFRWAIEKGLEPRQAAAINWHVCQDAIQGMATSLVCGVTANRGASGWMIGLADMPMLPKAAIVSVRDALRHGAVLAAPFQNGKRGHPVGFSSRYGGELLNLRGDGGARQILERDTALIHRIEIDHAGIFTDIDQPDDLQHFDSHKRELP